MPNRYTEADFDNLSWHDCNVWKIEFRVGDPDEGDWTSDLVLGIDFIAAWLCGVNKVCRFRVAPATLVFHDVNDLSIHIDWDKAANAHEASIHQIERELVDLAEIKKRGWGLHPPHYRWRIHFNWPESGEITFEASGFTQELLTEPMECEGQSFSLKQRDELLGRCGGKGSD
jgi:hypothetical protein